jgi:hypothetical protein
MSVYGSVFQICKRAPLLRWPIWKRPANCVVHVPRSKLGTNAVLNTQNLLPLTSAIGEAAETSVLPALALSRRS